MLLDPLREDAERLGHSLGLLPRVRGPSLNTIVEDMASHPEMYYLIAYGPDGKPIQWDGHTTPELMLLRKKQLLDRYPQLRQPGAKFKAIRITRYAPLES